MTPSQEIIDRYSKVERVADSLGRLIGVRRLRVSQQIKISEMTPALEGEMDVPGPDGTVAKLPRRMMPALAAAVCEIDSVGIPFPKTRGELDAIMDRLDIEGLIAVFEASVKLGQAAEADAPAGTESQKK